MNRHAVHPVPITVQLLYRRRVERTARRTGLEGALVWNPRADHLRRIARKRQMRLARSPRPGPAGEEQWALLNWNGTIVFGGGGPKPWGYSASLDEVEEYLIRTVGA